MYIILIVIAVVIVLAIYGSNQAANTEKARLARVEAYKAEQAAMPKTIPATPAKATVVASKKSAVPARKTSTKKAVAKKSSKKVAVKKN